MASSSRHRPSFAAVFDDVRDEETTASPRSPDYPYNDIEFRINIPKPTSPCFSETSEDLDTNDRDNYSEYSAGEAVLAEATDDGFEYRGRVVSIDGSIRSRSSCDDVMSSDTPVAPMYNTGPEVRLDANGRYTYDLDSETDASSPLTERIPVVTVDAKGNYTYDTNWETDSEAEDFPDPYNCFRSDKMDDYDESDAASEISGFWIPHEKCEAMSLKEPGSRTVTIVENDDYSSASSGWLKLERRLPSNCSECDYPEPKYNSRPFSSYFAQEDATKSRSLASDFFAKPESEHSFAYSDVIPSPSIRSEMSQVSQDLIDALVLSPSEASVFSVQSEGDSCFSDVEKNVSGQPSYIEDYPQDDVSVRSSMASVDSLSIQSSYSYDDRQQLMTQEELSQLLNTCS